MAHIVAIIQILQQYAPFFRVFYDKIKVQLNVCRLIDAF